MGVTTVPLATGRTPGIGAVCPGSPRCVCPDAVQATQSRCREAPTRPAGRGGSVCTRVLPCAGLAAGVTGIVSRGGYIATFGCFAIVGGGLHAVLAGGLALRGGSGGSTTSPVATFTVAASPKARTCAASPTQASGAPSRCGRAAGRGRGSALAGSRGDAL